VTSQRTGFIDHFVHAHTSTTTVNISQFNAQETATKDIYKKCIDKRVLRVKGAKQTKWKHGFTPSTILCNNSNLQKKCCNFAKLLLMKSYLH